MNKITTPAKSLKGKVSSRPQMTFSTTQPGVPPRITVLVYGAPGSGKTHFAGTFPKPLFLDMHGGLATVRHKKVAYIRPRTYAEMLEATIPENVKEFKTIVLDQLTEAARLLMKGALRMSGRELPQLQDWQLVIERLRTLCVTYTSEDTLPDKHIVFVAEEVVDKNEETGQILVSPDVPGKFTRRVGTFFDCMFHIRNAYNQQTKTKGRWMLTEPDGMYPAKDRLGGLDKLEVPDFNVLWEKVRKGERSKTT